MGELAAGTTYKSELLYLQGQVITVLVGSDSPTAFALHENLLCSSSEYFKRLRIGNWVESAKGSVSLKEEDPEVFQLYRYWLYRGKLPIHDDPAPARKVEEATEKKKNKKESEEQNEKDHCDKDEYTILAKAYVLGDILQDTNFKDFTLDSMLSTANLSDSKGWCYFPDLPQIGYIYDNTLDGSKARKLFVDLWVRNANPEWLDEEEGLPPLHREFLRDVTKRLVEVKHSGEELDELSGDTRDYHEHPDDPSTCYRNRLVVAS